MEEPSPEAWWRLQQQAVALRIEQVQQQARETCTRYGEGSLECAQAWARAHQAIEGLSREAALQPQVPYTPPEPVVEACLASEAAGYMQKVEAIDAAYHTALASGHPTPEQLTTLAGEMEAVAEEAAAWGCGGVAAEAQLRAQDIAEAARYAQEAAYLQEWIAEAHLPPADYIVFSGSIGAIPALKGGAKLLRAQQAVQTLSKTEGIEPLTWPSGGGSLIWIPQCEEVLWCFGGNLGVSPGSVSVKLTEGWFVSQAPACDEMATFFTQAKVVEGGLGIGMGYVWTSKYSAVEMGFYSPQISTNALPLISKLTTCKSLYLERAP